MRKLFFLLVVLSVVAFAWADQSKEPAHEPDYSHDFQFPAPSGVTVKQPLLSEDFESGVPPTGWTEVDNLGSSPVHWAQEDTLVDNNGGGSPLSNWTNGSGHCLAACSDCASGPFDVEVRSPVIDCSSAPGVALSFTVNYQNYANYDYFDVDVSNDGGSTWTNVLSWNEDHGGLQSTPGEDVSLDISSVAAGSSNVVVRFHYYDTRTDAWDWYVEIDNFVVAAVENRQGIPTLSGVGMGVMMALIAAAALFIIRRVA